MKNYCFMNFMERISLKTHKETAYLGYMPLTTDLPYVSTYREGICAPHSSSKAVPVVETVRMEKPKYSLSTLSTESTQKCHRTPTTSLKCCGLYWWHCQGELLLCGELEHHHLCTCVTTSCVCSLQK